MDSRFRDWAAQSLSSASQNSYLSGLRSIEGAYGDLDALWAQDRFAAVYRDLSYSSSDERARRGNPSRVPIQRNLAKQLSNLRSHLRFYESFKDGAEDTSNSDPATPEDASDDSAPVVLSLERDLERALRNDLSQIEPGLRLADGGVQVGVPSGRIDILAQDSTGRRVVIELKAVRAPRDAVAQVLAYMGDLAAEGGSDVRGLLIAPDFDPRAIAAARMVPALRLMRFSVSFAFEKVGPPA